MISANLARLRFTRSSLLVLTLLILSNLIAASPSPAQDAAELWLEGKAAIASGRWEEAHEIFRMFADNFADSPRLPEAWLELARTEPDGHESRRWLELIVKEHPASDAAGNALILLAEADLLTRSPERAVVRLRSIEREGYPLSIRRRGLLFRAEAKRLTEDLEGATIDFSDVLDSEPDDSEAARALLGLAAVSVSRGDLRQAELYVSECFSRFPRGDMAATSLWRWAGTLMEQGLAGRAEDVLDRLAKRYPMTPESAAARETLDRMAEARARLPEAQEPAPREAPAVEGRADSLPVQDTSGDTVIVAWEDSAAVVIAELEEVEYIVRLGSFSFWEDADQLRRELEADNEFGLRVVPDRNGDPPYHLESMGIQNRRRAFDFARWLESVGGYLTETIENPAERH